MSLNDMFSVFLNLSIQYISFVFIFYYFNEQKVRFKEVLLGVLIVFIPALSIYSFSMMSGIIYLFLSQFVYLYIKYPNFKTITYLGLSIVIGLCADHFTSISLLKLMLAIPIPSLYLRIIIYSLLSVCFAYIIKRIMISLFGYFSQKMALIFTVVLILMIGIFYINIYPYLKDNSIERLLINGMFIALFTITFFILSAMLIRVKISRYQLNLEKQEYENFKSYVSAVERINNDMQRFRHDYLNVLLGMKGFIQERDIDGLTTFFEEGIMKFENKTLSSSKVVKILERLKEPSLKGLLFNKFIYAHEQDIAITLEIAETIQLPKIKLHIELIRIIGILLDNAIDNSLVHPNHRIEIAMLNLNNSVLLVIRNQIDPNEFDVKKIFQEGYSTKGKGRGLGLSNIKSIIGNVDELSMHYWVEDGWYNFELFIKGEV